MNTIDLKDKTAVVTGAARGIGFSIARRLTASGARCAIWDRDEAAAVAAADQLEGAIAVTVDVSAVDSVASAAATTLERWGGVDLLVNNAGIAGASKKLWDCSPEEWQEVLQIDLFGIFLCLFAVPPADGMGELQYTSNDIYRGYWKDGTRHGSVSGLHIFKETDMTCFPLHAMIVIMY